MLFFGIELGAKYVLNVHKNITNMYNNKVVDIRYFSIWESIV